MRGQSKKLHVKIGEKKYPFILDEKDPSFHKQLDDIYQDLKSKRCHDISLLSDFGWKDLKDSELFVLKKLKKLCHLFNVNVVCTMQQEKTQPSKSKKVLFVDDSPTMHKIYKKILKSFSEEIEDYHCEHPKDALRLLKNHDFDAFVFDYEMPELTGVELFDKVRKTTVKPTIFITSLSKDDCPEIVWALQKSGGFDYLQKPKGQELETFQKDFCQKLKMGLKVAPEEKNVGESFPSVQLGGGANTHSLVAIGTSTGGPQTVRQLLSQLTGPHPPIVICQHMPASFVGPFAKNIAEDFSLNVVVPGHGEKVNSNTVYVCAGDRQTTLVSQSQGLTFKVTDDPPMNRFRPSVDYLFFGLAKLSSVSIFPVLLTGMGKDGAKGLLELKKRGHPTIAQDEETSIVYGMPKEARDIGAVDKVLPDHKVMGSLSVALRAKQVA